MKPLKKKLKKLKNRSGFTLSEVLICVLILLLITAVVAGALPVAQNVYYKVVDGANAQVLLSTTIAALRDELSTAGQLRVERDVPVEGVTASYKITYRSAETGGTSGISVTDEGFLLQQYTDEDLTPSTNEGDKTRPLVSKKAATGELYATCESIDCEDGVVTFTGLCVKKPGTEQPLALVETFCIRAIDPK